MSSDDLKVDLTYEKKTTYGIIGIVLGVLFWGIGHPYIGIMDVVLLIFPCIFLAIPSQTTKNSKGLAYISMIILVIAFLLLIGGHYINQLTRFFQLILCIYGFFCAYVMTIPTDPKEIYLNTSNMNTNYQKYDKYCVNCGQGLLNDSQFCSRCGAKVINNIQIDSPQEAEKEVNENVCIECGHELYDDSKFCPECGVEVINNFQVDSPQEAEKEVNENVCIECGHELYDDLKFCPECGAKVTTSNVK
ncbi:zinc ribbon domain-containing protein [uncultured Methanobrevibacter sp.]|uniref:double zinc ribbon domain-containing protein n=1 Tax=uncultured Methanobrevibacter sp. TaxID=253161 RepID=UPI0026059DDD|nr:zinc ribbon domain-containing protein [uncultured Methanobrevibacter sp.]